MAIQLNEEQIQSLLDALLDSATGQPLTEREQININGGNQKVIRKKDQPIDRDLILNLLSQNDRGIGGPQDYC